MFNSLFLLLVPYAATPAVDLPTKKYLNLAAIKTMAAAAEAEAEKRNVQVTICIVDESGNLVFLEKSRRRATQHYRIRSKKSQARCPLQEPLEGWLRGVEEGES